MCVHAERTKGQRGGGGETVAAAYGRFLEMEKQERRSKMSLLDALM